MQVSSDVLVGFPRKLQIHTILTASRLRVFSPVMWYARALLELCAMGVGAQTAAEALATERANAAAVRAELEAELAAAHRERRERSAGATPSQDPNINPKLGSHHSALPERHAPLSPGRRAPSSMGRRRGSREGLASTRAGLSPHKDPRQLKRPLQMAPTEALAQPGLPAPQPDEGLGGKGQPRLFAAAERGPAALWQRLWACAGDALASLLGADTARAPTAGSQQGSALEATPGTAAAALPVRAPLGHMHAARRPTPATVPTSSHAVAGQAESAHLDALRQRLRELGAGADASVAVFTAACAFLRRALAGEGRAPARAAADTAVLEGSGQASVSQHAAAEAALALVRALLQHCAECRALALASCGALHEGEGLGTGDRCGGAAQPSGSAAGAAGGLAQGVRQGQGQGSALAGAAHLDCGLSSRITLVGLSGPLALAAAPAYHGLAGGKGGPDAWRGSEAALHRSGNSRFTLHLELRPGFQCSLLLQAIHPVPCRP